MIFEKFLEISKLRLKYERTYNIGSKSDCIVTDEINQWPVHFFSVRERYCFSHKRHWTWRSFTFCTLNKIYLNVPLLILFYTVFSPYISLLDSFSLYFSIFSHALNLLSLFFSSCFFYSPSFILKFLHVWPLSFWHRIACLLSYLFYLLCCTI